MAQLREEMAHFVVSPFQLDIDFKLQVISLGLQLAGVEVGQGNTRLLGSVCDLTEQSRDLLPCGK